MKIFTLADFGGAREPGCGRTRQPWTVGRNESAGSPWVKLLVMAINLTAVVYLLRLGYSVPESVGVVLCVGAGASGELNVRPLVKATAERFLLQDSR
ncbi:hypothetical protein SAMN05216377_110118 [Pseudonocardia oroxyli]|uniref:Uncharacterized protein n=1 Tax=Pseudonocardia oroxyli TaxID=366584 RepID=A0A1G7SW61_PSEOR|nr:hypothetical protein SAMN05216377_110118 [Pseudonocardia oroxyli]